MKYISLALALVFAASLIGCGSNNGGQTVVIDIEDPTAAPVTAAPTAVPTEVPTEAPTPEPTAQPNPGKRKVYLTFDDGPYKYTDQFLAVLAQYNVRATFFTIGDQIEKYPEQAKHILEGGHVLGCHTQTHNLNAIYASTDALVRDIAKWRETVIKAVGSDAGAYVMRFPGGTTNTTIGGRKGRDPYVAAVNAAGYYAFDWNLGINDRWLAGNTQGLSKVDWYWYSYQDTYATFQNTDPLILIIHDTEPTSLDILARIIEDLIAKGFDFGTVDEIGDNYLM